MKTNRNTFWKFCDTKLKPEFQNDVKTIHVSTLFTKS